MVRNPAVIRPRPDGPTGSATDTSARCPSSPSTTSTTTASTVRPRTTSSRSASADVATRRPGVRPGGPGHGPERLHQPPDPHLLRRLVDRTRPLRVFLPEYVRHRRVAR